MTKLAQSSGTIIHEAESRLYISKRPARWISTFLFVTGLLILILFANGMLQLTLFKDETTGTSTIGFILILVALFFAVIFWRVRVYQKKINAIPLHELQHKAIFDFENNNLLDGQQNILTPINQAWLMRKMQITSSSPELLISWNGGSLSIVKGNPFSGGIADIEKTLTSKGIRKK